MPENNGGPQAVERKAADVGAAVARARDELEHVASRAKDTITSLDRTLERNMRENPLLVLGAAVGVGYVIGRLFSRFR